MNINFKVVSGNKTYEHLPMPSVVINNTYEFVDESTEFIRKVVQWRISGILVPDNGDIDEQVLELESIYASGVLVSAIIADTATALETMPADGGIKVLNLNFPEGSGPEWATKRQYEITINGYGIPTSVRTSGECSYKISYNTEQSGMTSRTISGTMKDTYGKAAVAKYQAYSAAQGWAAWGASNITGNNYTVNKDGTLCEFSLSHQQYWDSFPAGISNAEVSTEVTTDIQGVTHTRIQGWFEGGTTSCANAINALIPSGVQVGWSVVRGKYTNRTSFNMDYITSTIGDIVQMQETLTIQEPVYDFVMKRVLGGAAPVKQNTSLTSCKCTQSGTIKGLVGYPSEPAYNWNSSGLKNVSISQLAPEKTYNGNNIFALNYSYEFEFETNPGW